MGLTSSIYFRKETLARLVTFESTFKYNKTVFSDTPFYTGHDCMILPRILSGGRYQPAGTSILSITATAKISNARRTTTSRASFLAVRTADPPPSDASHAPRARRPRVLERALSGRSKTCAARFSSSGAWGGFSPFPLAPARGARGPRSLRARPPPRVISSRVRQPRARTRSENDGLARGEARPGRERFEA